MLACVRQASTPATACECHIVSISTSRQVRESGIMTPNNPEGIQRLFDLLSSSFGGGTDLPVPWNLPSRHWKIMILEMEIGAVRILVSRGRQQPWTLRIYCWSPMVKFLTHLFPRRSWNPVHRLIAFKGVEIYGLFIGKVESTPLDTVCTQTHHFLSHYEGLLLPKKRQQHVT